MSYDDTLHFSHIADLIIGELVGLIENEGFDLTPGEQDHPDLLMDDLANGLDSESYGRVAALLTLVESIEDTLPDPATAYRWRNACLPGRLKRKDREPFTVIGTYEATGQKWADTVWAKDADHAAALVEGGTVTEEPVAVAGVIEGEAAVA